MSHVISGFDCDSLIQANGNPATFQQLKALNRHLPHPITAQHPNGIDGWYADRVRGTHDTMPQVFSRDILIGSTAGQRAAAWREFLTYAAANPKGARRAFRPRGGYAPPATPKADVTPGDFADMGFDEPPATPKAAPCDFGPAPGPAQVPPTPTPVVDLSNYVTRPEWHNSNLVTTSRFATIESALAHMDAARVIEVRINGDEPKAPADHCHPVFETVLRAALAGLNVLLVGPAGCGKSHMCDQIAGHLGVPFGSLSYSAGASESGILGRLLPTGDNGRFEWSKSEFCHLYEQASVHLHDEIDGADPNMLLVLNAALANGKFYNPTAGRVFKRHAQAIQIGAANTFGTGAGAMYVGRAQLDAATLDRWYVVEMDYDRAYERTQGSPEVCNWVWNIRERANASKVRRVVSTRMIQKAHRATSAGIPFADAKRALLAGWTVDELAKVGERA